MTSYNNRREFLRRLGISAAALPFALNLPSLSFAGQLRPKQRLVIVFSPNGVVPGTFWPDSFGEDFAFKESLTPLESLRERTLILHGVCDKVRGDGDNHMRGIGCLLTGTELYPGNVQGGSDTPAGWASGLSIDQEIANYLQANSETRTRFGSLEFGVMVPDYADTWTRMVYAGPNKPIAPIDSPYQMFGKLYGRMKDRESLGSVLDDLQDDFKKLGAAVSGDDRKLLEEHAALVRDLETELRTSDDQSVGHAVPVLEPGVREENDDMPKISKLQIELMVNSFAADFARVATLQFTNSVGQAKMHWLDIQEGHHELSHHEDSKKESQEKLTRINRWYCEQIAYLAKRLAETSEPGAEGSMLDHTLIVWTNELGKGNDHSLDNIPFVIVGGGLGIRMGRAIDFPSVPHNRLWLSLAQAFGHDLKRFGNPDYCGDGALAGLT
jgi:Protein of unknown function (DUF1552)